METIKPDDWYQLDFDIVTPKTTLQNISKLIAELKTQYDYVIFDCPPVIPVADAGVLGPQCDGILMVLQAGRTQRGIILHAQDRLRAVKAKVLGYCMTNIEYHIPEYIYRYL